MSSWTAQIQRPVFLGDGGVELMVKLTCPAPLAAPHKADAAQTYDGLLSSMRQALAALPEAATLLEARRQLVRFGEEEERLRQEIADTEKQAAAALASGNGALAALAARQSSARQQLDVLHRLGPKLRESLSASTESFRAVAREAARQQQQVLLDRLAAEEQELAGVVQECGEQLGRAVACGSLADALRKNYRLGDQIAEIMAAELAPPLPAPAGAKAMPDPFGSKEQVTPSPPFPALPPVVVVPSPPAVQEAVRPVDVPPGQAPVVVPVSPGGRAP
jgi:hypothetical protein